MAGLSAYKVFVGVQGDGYFHWTVSTNAGVLLHGGDQLYADRQLAKQDAYRAIKRHIFGNWSGTGEDLQREFDK